MSTIRTTLGKKIKAALLAALGLTLSTPLGAAGQGIPTIADKYIVFVYLPGGADSLAIMQPDEGRAGPYALDLHVQRPTIFRLESNTTPALDILPLGSSGYVVPTVLSEFQTAYNNNQFAAVQKVGIPNIPRAQAEAEDILARGIPTVDGAQTDGWMQRFGKTYLRSPLEVWDASGGHKMTTGGHVYRPTVVREHFTSTLNFLPLPAPSTASENRFRLDSAFLIASKGNSFPTFEQDKMNSYLAQMKDLHPLYLSTAPVSLPAGQAYQNTTFGRQFQTIDHAFAKFREAKFGFVRGPDQENFGQQGQGIATFDTHRGEIAMLDNQLSQLNAALNRFRLNMMSRPHAGGGSKGTMWDNTVVVIFSEYGRTVAENNTSGTDDGEGQTVFFLGGAVRPGIYGSILNLSEVYSLRNVIPVETNLVNVWWEIISALGYDPAPIFPGWAGQRLGVIN